MTINIEVLAKVISPIITLIIGAIVNVYAERRARIITFLGHASAFEVQAEKGNFSIFTHSTIVRNTGRKSATNVRIGHQILPLNVTVQPRVKYQIEENPEGAKEIVIPVLVPKEQISISYLYYPPLTWDKINTYVKHDEGIAKAITAIPMPLPPKWVVAFVWISMFFTVSFALYYLVRFVIYNL